jgi:hypothetical protein
VVICVGVFYSTIGQKTDPLETLGPIGHHLDLLDTARTKWKTQGQILKW